MVKKVLGSLAFTIIVGFFGWIATGISLLFFWNHVFIAPLVVSFFGCLIIFVNALIFGLFKHRSKKMKLGVFMAFFAVVFGGYYAYQAYMESLEMEDAEVDLTEYQPFASGTKAVALEEESTLMLEGELPKIDGATALYPLFSAFAQATYPQNEYLYYDSEVMSTKTDQAYKRLFNDEVDVIFAAGPSENQLLTAENLEIELEMTPIGREAFVFFVNSRNPVKGLSTAEIQQIYSGDVTNWSELGGANKDIQAFQRPEDSGSQTALQKLMEGKRLMNPPSKDVVGGMGGIIEETSNYRNHSNAIGFSYRFFSTEMVQNGDIHLLEIDGVQPNKESIRSNKYPISAEFYAITAGTVNPNVDKLIDWILSEQGQWLVEETGYVPVE